MPAYVIVETHVRDREQYERYRAAAAAAIAAGGGRYIARGGELAVLEGDWRPKRIVVLAFEDLEAAKRWYDSPDYREAKQLRKGAATLQASRSTVCRTAARAETAAWRSRPAPKLL